MTVEPRRSERDFEGWNEASLNRVADQAADILARRGGEWVIDALHKQLDEMTLHEDLPDSFDIGYMAAIREIRQWAEQL